MPSSNAMLCILALLPLAQSSAPPPPSPMSAALSDARIAEPEAVVRALIEVIRINPTAARYEEPLGPAGWLADLRGFDGPERQEMSDLLRTEGVGLADRSKLRRLAIGATQLTTVHEEAAAGVWRRAQQADLGREESAANTQLKKQQGDHAGTAQPNPEEADDGSAGLSGDSACSPSLWHPSCRLVPTSLLLRREIPQCKH
jgi:hypothetical protein